MSFSMFLTNVIAIILMSYTINTLLLQVHGKYTVPILYLYIILVGAFAGKFIGFYSTPFFLLGILIILYISGGPFRLLNMLLSLIAWMWNVLSIYIGSFITSTKNVYKKGYHVTEACVLTANNHPVSIFSRIHSSSEKDYKSVNTITFSAMEQAAALFGKVALAMDRGYDDNKMFLKLDGLKQDYVICLGNRISQPS